MSDQDISPSLQAIIDHVTLERIAWKHAYITAYLANTGYTIDQVELCEEQIFDHALCRIIINYYLKKKQ